MSTIYGILQIADRDTTVESVGQRAVYEALQLLIDRHNEDMNAATSAFVEEVTTIYQEKYFLPGGGQMQRSNRLTRPGAVKPLGEYTVAYDLLDLRDQVAWDDITLAYMTLNKLQAALRNIEVRHANSIRFEILRHLLNNANETFVDEVRGSLVVRRLANSDGTTYPPVVGADSSVDDNHYLASGYIASAISDVNNPFPVIREELEEHFGTGNPVAFINNAQRAKIEALVDYIPVSDSFVSQGSATPTIVGNGPAGLPGTVIGRVSNVWISEWRWMPANYIFTLDVDQPAPLKKRIDEPESIRGRGRLELVAEQEEFPLTESFWRCREGYGVGNRVNGVAMELTADATYDIPAAYI